MVCYGAQACVGELLSSYVVLLLACLPALHLLCIYQSAALRVDAMVREASHRLVLGGLFRVSIVMLAGSPKSMVLSGIRRSRIGRPGVKYLAFHAFGS